MISKIINWFKEDFFKKIVKNTMTLVAGNVGASILGSISLVLSIKVLGIEVFGLFIIMQTYIRIFNGLLNFQSWEAIIKFGAEAITDKNEDLLKSYIRQGVILDFLSALLGTVAAMLFVTFIGSRYGWDEKIMLLTRFFCLIILFNLTGTPTGILRLFGKFKIFSFQKIFSSIIKLLGVVIALILKADLAFYVVIVIITEVTGYIILICMGYKTYKENTSVSKNRIGFINGKKFLKFTLLSNINSTLALPINEFDKVIVSLISFEAVGVYKLIKQIINIIGKIVTPVYQTIYPELAKLISEKNFRKAVSVSKKLGLIMFGVGLPFLIILAPTSLFWLKWITGVDSINYSIILSLFLLQKVLSNLFICVNSLFISTGYIKYNLYISIFGSILYTLLAYFFTLYLGLAGILVASVIEMFCNYFIKIFILSQDKRLRESNLNIYY